MKISYINGKEIIDPDNGNPVTVNGKEVKPGLSYDRIKKLILNKKFKEKKHCKEPDSAEISTT